MNIETYLLAACHNLQDAKEEAVKEAEYDLAKKIRDALDATKGAVLLADTDEKWLEETDAAWLNFSANDCFVARFAASVTAKELRKYADRAGNNINKKSHIWRQIHDLEAVASGGDTCTPAPGANYVRPNDDGNPSDRPAPTDGDGASATNTG